MAEPVEFSGTIQSRGQGGRMAVEIPSDVRCDFEVGDPVKVIIRLLK